MASGDPSSTRSFNRSPPGNAPLDWISPRYFDWASVNRTDSFPIAIPSSNSGAANRIDGHDLARLRIYHNTRTAALECLKGPAQFVHSALDGLRILQGVQDRSHFGSGSLRPVSNSSIEPMLGVS